MKAPATITVRGRDFRISFISNFFAVNYYELKQETLKAQEAYYEASAAQDKLKDGKITTEAAARAVEHASEVVRSVGTKDFFERRLDLVREACESNDLEYDRRFWERKTSPEDLVHFLDQVYLYGTRGEEEPHGEEKSKKGKGRDGSAGT